MIPCGGSFPAWPIATQKIRVYSLLRPNCHCGWAQPQIKQCIQGASAPEPPQMRLAPAIRSPGPRQHDGRTRHPADGGGPLMLASHAAAVPHGLQPCVPAQVVDVPVGLPDFPRVVADAGTEPSGAERAADVQGVAGTEAQVAEAADADGAARGTSEYENVGAGYGGDHGSILRRAGLDCGRSRQRPRAARSRPC
jgi:hypothetical protein